MNILVTGGAGFIGRWVVQRLLNDSNRVVVLDNLSNGSVENIEEFNEKNFKLVKGSINSKEDLDIVFKEKFDIIYHLAASINVQDSIDDPSTTFYNDTVGTFNILLKAKEQMFGKSGRMEGDNWIIDPTEDTHPCKVVFMSTCMIYDKSLNNGIDEGHPIKPVSPYGGSKIAAENMVLSFFYSYKLPVVVIRPFNTYGPYQKSSGEGGVVAIFIKKALEGSDIIIYGSGEQTRDLLYVKDCANFIVKSGYSKNSNGEILNAGSGKDITINELAKKVSKGRASVKHVEHIHPQSEIQKLLCDYNKAKDLIGWSPSYTLDKGIEETEQWIKKKYFSFSYKARHF